MMKGRFVVLLLVMVLAIASAQKMRKGKPGKKWLRRGCFAPCIDECTTVRQLWKTCTKDCKNQCDKGFAGKDCRQACRSAACDALGLDEGEVAEARGACQKCRGNEQFQTCAKDFKSCGKENCADVCPKRSELAEGEKRRPKACKVCLRNKCGLDADYIEDLEDAMDA